MTIYFATVFDAKNVHLWSGLGYYMGKMLEEQGNTVIYLNDLNLQNAFMHKTRKRFMEKVFNKSYSPNFSLRIAQKYAKQIRKRVPPGSIIFTPNSILISQLGKDYKTVLYTDCTFRRLLNFYPSFTNISRKYTYEGDQIEAMAAHSASALIYSSAWAARSAVNDYGIASSKISTAPFGSNMNSKLDNSELESVIQQRLNSPQLHLLFIAASWYRKGGDYAVDVVRMIKRSGVNVTLHVVGVRKLPPNLEGLNIINHGYISKSSEKGQSYLKDLFTCAHFLLLPSRADCTPVVVSEACSFALPSMISNVGGNGEIVTKNVNGEVFDFKDETQHCADRILQYWSDHVAYRNLCISSYNRYHNELNWNTTGRKINKILFSLSHSDNKSAVMKKDKKDTILIK